MSRERPPLLVSGAILTAAALIACTLAILLRYGVSPATPMPAAYRLDRWSGEIVLCRVDATGADNRLDCQHR